jgi:pyruvate-formate lyase-activating enzyme
VSTDRAALERVKIQCLSTGIQVSATALDLLSNGGTELLTIHEYPTTGGLTLVLDEDVIVNAPFDEWFCAEAEVHLDLDADGLFLQLDDDRHPVHRVLPLPGYLGHTDSHGRQVSDIAMSHADRVRVSPVVGCAYDCGFCDLPLMRYQMRDRAQIVEALLVAAEDAALPARHVLISGGSPRRPHVEQFIQLCADVIRASPLPVDVMFSPTIDDLSIVDRLVDAGAHSFSINIEVYSASAASDLLRTKQALTHKRFAETIERAVDLLGSTGRVRSLIIPGLEPVEATLEGVDFLASLGCDPVLSPFRPSEGVALSARRPPTAEDLRDILEESRRIVAKYGVGLGPECVPCQHNTLTFPWDARKAGVPG